MALRNASQPQSNNNGWKHHCATLMAAYRLMQKKEKVMETLHRLDLQPVHSDRMPSPTTIRKSTSTKQVSSGQCEICQLLEIDPYCSKILQPYGLPVKWACAKHATVHEAPQILSNFDFNQYRPESSRYAKNDEQSEVYSSSGSDSSSVGGFRFSASNMLVTQDEPKTQSKMVYKKLRRVTRGAWLTPEQYWQHKEKKEHKIFDGYITVDNQANTLPVLAASKNSAVSNSNKPIKSSLLSMPELHKKDKLMQNKSLVSAQLAEPQPQTVALPLAQPTGKLADTIVRSNPVQPEEQYKLPPTLKDLKDARSFAKRSMQCRASKSQMVSVGTTRQEKPADLSVQVANAKAQLASKLAKQRQVQEPKNDKYASLVKYRGHYGQIFQLSGGQIVPLHARRENTASPTGAMKWAMTNAMHTQNAQAINQELAQKIKVSEQILKHCRNNANKYAF